MSRLVFIEERLEAREAASTARRIQVRLQLPYLLAKLLFLGRELPAVRERNNRATGQRREGETGVEEQRLEDK